MRGPRTVPVDVHFLESLAGDRRRARIIPEGAVQQGDRLRFGEPAGGNVCLLGTLEAEVVAIDGDTAVLVFTVAEPFLSEAIDLLTPPKAGSTAP
jgi:hypothetical protein